MAVQEKSAGVVVFRRENAAIRFLLLFKKYKSEYYDLVKGNVEKGETPQETAKREAGEEAGLTGLKFLPGFAEKIQWWYRKDGRLVQKTVTYYLAETGNAKAKVSEEHIRADWATLEEAEKLIRHKETLALLKKAQAFIEKREKEGLGRFL